MPEKEKRTMRGGKNCPSMIPLSLSCCIRSKTKKAGGLAPNLSKKLFAFQLLQFLKYNTFDKTVYTLPGCRDPVFCSLW